MVAMRVDESPGLEVTLAGRRCVRICFCSSLVTSKLFTSMFSPNCGYTVTAEVPPMQLSDGLFLCLALSKHPQSDRLERSSQVSASGVLK